MAKIKVGGREHTGLSYKGITIKWEEHTPAEIAKIFNDLGYIPPAALRKSVRTPAEKVRNLAKGLAPRRTGALRVGLVVGKIERTSTPGKIVYDVRFDRRMNEVFAKVGKTTIHPKTGEAVVGRAYYPSSMEYGFVTRSGKKWAGKHYLRNAAVDLTPYSEQLVMDAMWKKVMSIWKKKNGGSE